VALWPSFFCFSGVFLRLKPPLDLGVYSIMEHRTAMRCGQRQRAVDTISWIYSWYWVLGTSRCAVHKGPGASKTNAPKTGTISCKLGTGSLSLHSTPF
jgi:hypothetical protein